MGLEYCVGVDGSVEVVAGLHFPLVARLVVLEVGVAGHGSVGVVHHPFFVLDVEGWEASGEAFLPLGCISNVLEALHDGVLAKGSLDSQGCFAGTHATVFPFEHLHLLV